MNNEILQDVKRKFTYKCGACYKNFSALWNLKRHHENTLICKLWLDKVNRIYNIKWDNIANTNIKIPIDIKNKNNIPQILNTNKIITGSFIQELLIPKNTSCPYCHRIFISISCVNRHYKTSIICDRLRAESILKKIYEPNILDKIFNIDYDYDKSIVSRSF